jgi:hypothetical protein
MRNLSKSSNTPETKPIRMQAGLIYTKVEKINET